MPEISIKDQVKKLVELQKLDGEIYELKQSLKEKPLQLEELKAQFEAKKDTLKSLEQQVKDVQVKRKEFELELQGKEDSIAKANAALNLLKTNKEYTAKITEIESMKADKSVSEEKILKSYDEADAINVEIDKEKQNVAKYDQDFQTQSKSTQEDMKTMEERVKVIQGQRAQITPDIDKVSLTRYEKLLSHKEGKAIVSSAGNSCGGCFMNVSQQQINAMKMFDALVECEFCSRILYIEEDIES